MKIEYLLIKPNNDFCSNEEQFICLLKSNKRIAIDNEHIKLSKCSFDYTLKSSEVNWKKNKEIINEECGNQFKINTIWDDVSIYYSQKLYPAMIEIENVLRKLIYRFMIKTVGSSWFSYSTPLSVKDAMKKDIIV